MSIQIRPAIDLINGQCVRLEKGDFNKVRVYSKYPVDQAKYFEDLGCKYLHIVDLDAARSGSFQQYKVVESVAHATSLSIDVGGGMYSDVDVYKAFEHGAKQITAGSIAVKNKDLVISWLEEFGTSAIILGMDIQDGNVLTRGWQDDSGLAWQKFINPFLDAGMDYCISTDVSKDGMLEGPSQELYQEIMTHSTNLKLIASGGVSNLDDVRKLNSHNIYGVIIGKAIYEGKISGADLTHFILENPQ